MPDEAWPDPLIQIKVRGLPSAKPFPCPLDNGLRQDNGRAMLRHLIRVLVICVIAIMVLTAVGCTVFTRMLCGASALASVRINPTMPCLDAA